MHFYTDVRSFRNKILVRGYRDGKSYQEEVDFLPTLYLHSRDNQESQFSSLDGVPLEPLQPGTIKETKDFIKKYRGVEGFEYYGMESAEYQFISETFPGVIKYDSNLVRVGYIDIEVGSEQGFPTIEKADEEVTAVTFFFQGKIITLSCLPFENPDPDKIKFITCDCEETLLHKFLDVWVLLKLDVISGWHIEGFDIPYMVNRITKLLGKRHVNRLSPWGMVHEKIVNMANGRQQQTYDIIGIATLDYLPAYKKFSMVQRESYRLDFIAQEEVNTGKLDYSEFENLHMLYKHDPQKYLEYNIKDTELVSMINDKRLIIELIMNLAYYAKVNYIDCFKQTVMWDCIIYNHLKAKNIIIPKKNPQHDGRHVPGGHVKDPRPAKYNWIASLDLNSLYPHLILQYNISPDTFVDKIDFDLEKIINETQNYGPLEIAHQKDLSLAGNGTLYRKDHMGFLPEILENLYQERSDYKKQMISAKKILEEIQTEKSKRGIE